MNPDETSRREFVVLTCACCAAALCPDVLAGDAPQSTTIDLGPLDDFKPEGAYDKFAKSNKLLILSTGKRLAVSTARCTHKNCVLKVDGKQLLCPCHKSKFDNDGIPLNGPAKVSLNRYAVSIQDDHLIVDLSKQFEERRWDEAGAFLEFTN